MNLPKSMNCSSTTIIRCAILALGGNGYSDLQLRFFSFITTINNVHNIGQYFLVREIISAKYFELQGEKFEALWYAGKVSVIVTDLMRH